MILYKVREGALICLLLVGVIISLCLAEYAVTESPSGNFYLLPTRSWELGMGAILAIALPHIPFANSPAKQAVSIAALVVLLASFALFSEAVPMPSAYGLIPVMATVVLIASATKETWAGSILSHRWLVSMGLISYGAYLWHQPLYAFTRLATMQKLSGPTAILLMAVTIVLAYATYRYVETPFRNKQTYSRKIIFSATIIISLALISLSLVAIKYDGFKKRYSAEQRQILAFENYHHAKPSQRPSCTILSSQKISDIPVECFSSREKNVVLWGDSHAGALSLEMHQQIKDPTILVGSGCAPIIDYQPAIRPYCVEINRFFMNQIASIKPAILVMHANWLLSSEQVGEDIANGLSKTISEVKRRSPATRIILIGGVPQFFPTLPKRMLKAKLGLEKGGLLASSSYTEIRDIDRMLEQIAIGHNVRFVSVLNEFCRDNKCQSVVRSNGANEPLVWDYGHVTRTGSALIVQTLGFEKSTESNALKP